MGHIVSFIIGYFILHFTVYLIHAWYLGNQAIEEQKQKENNGIDR
jgi:hypothetical protein